MLTFSLNTTDRDICDALQLIMGFNTNAETEREWLGTAFLNALEGRIEEGGVDLKAYASSCYKYERLTKIKKEVEILPDEDIDKGTAKGVTSAVFNYVDSNIEAIVESTEFQTQVESFLEMRDYLLVEEGIDLWTILNLAKDSNDRALNTIRGLIKDYSMGDLIRGILTNNNNFFEVVGTLV